MKAKLEDCAAALKRVLWQFLFYWSCSSLLFNKPSLYCLKKWLQCFTRRSFFFNFSSLVQRSSDSLCSASHANSLYSSCWRILMKFGISCTFTAHHTQCGGVTWLNIRVNHQRLVVNLVTRFLNLQTFLLISFFYMHTPFEVTMYSASPIASFKDQSGIAPAMAKAKCSSQRENAYEAFTTQWWWNFTAVFWPKPNISFSLVLQTTLTFSV